MIHVNNGLLSVNVESYPLRCSLIFEIHILQSIWFCGLLLVVNFTTSTTRSTFDQVERRLVKISGNCFTFILRSLFNQYLIIRIVPIPGHCMSLRFLTGNKNHFGFWPKDNAWLVNAFGECNFKGIIWTPFS